MADLSALPGLHTVSRETQARLTLYKDLLVKWQRSVNLISLAAGEDIWRRHFADSAQLLTLAPDRFDLWLDIGSGAGFPGLVIAVLLRDRHPGAEVILVESDARKCAFLQTVIAATDAPARVLAMRADRAARHMPAQPDVISARALAPLPRLCEIIWPFWAPGCVGLFPKGRNVGEELTHATKHWSMQLTQHPSCTARDGTILKLEALARVRT